MSATATASGFVSLMGLDPATYVPHALHQPGRTYAETNCYTDILIELLHARGVEPLAALGCTLRIDVEGDQWTFFKPFPEDLELLYGIDVHEMQPYRPLAEQAVEQIAHGRTLIVELDSWHLPDTVATAYRRQHVKSSVVVEAIDPAGERLRYFHGTGLYELCGDDYRGALRLGRELSEDVLPPYTELVRFDAGPCLSGGELREVARTLVRRHLDRRPASNPFARFATQLERDLPRLLAGDADDYHAYAFATVRMAGSAFEVAASQAQWLLGDAATPAAEALMRIVEGCKALSFKLARRRAFDPAPALAAAAAAWDEAMGLLDGALG
ncbi:MAG TPA: DUF1839 family protein [Solirubrobacteraceae bacterium]|jgi:hypothetical protein|nr:DUF1839 family protein [Solirubrobacteraceae bacterium]